MDNKARKDAGLPYKYDDTSMLSNQHAYQDKMEEYNRTFPSETELRHKLSKEVFGDIGENAIVETPIHANWGCHNVHIGKETFINSNVTFVDDADILIGDCCLVAPNVVFCTAGHPILPILRTNHYVYCLPIHVGNNVWIGSAVQIMPGVTIGDNSVIGAGSVVTNDIPSDVVAFGAPCKVFREIGEKDREFYFKDRKLDVSE